MFGKMLGKSAPVQRKKELKDGPREERMSVVLQREVQGEEEERGRTLALGPLSGITFPLWQLCQALA